MCIVSGCDKYYQLVTLLCHVQGLVEHKVAIKSDKYLHTFQNPHHLLEPNNNQFCGLRVQAKHHGSP